MLRKLITAPAYMLRYGAQFGSCPVCRRRTIFYARGDWIREQSHCIRCHSIARWGALLLVIEKSFPDWRQLAIHESSPGGKGSQRIALDCPGYVPSHFYDDLAPGECREGIRSEDLERQTFADATFDIVVTQDVLEHVFEPSLAFAEIARTLRPGGAHIFTVPWSERGKTQTRARREKSGAISYLAPKVFHGNPLSREGSLVVTDWGGDLLEFIEQSSGFKTEVCHIRDPRHGVPGEGVEIFVSRKSM